MISSVKSYSTNLYAKTNYSLLSKLANTETSKDSTSNLTLSDEATDSSTFSNDRSSLTLEELLGSMQQTAQKQISISSEMNPSTSESGIGSVDADGDGTISEDEYDELMSQMGITDAACAKDFFAQYDTDADGEITSAEMDAGIPMGPMGPPPARPESASSYLDTDGDGIVSTEEYKAAVTELGIDDTEATEALFAKYDTDSNGEITSDELKAQQSTTVDSTNSTSAMSNLTEFQKVAARVLASYEANYQYMFETDDSMLSNIL
jgi:Ca2+-binding EF-hand superfamily protein